MYAIKAGLRKSRKKGNPGIIIFHIREGKAERIFTTGIQSTEEELITTHRHVVIQGLKCLYDIIEDYHTSGNTYNIDDIAIKFREQLESGTDNIDISTFIVNHKIATVGKPFNKWIYSARANREISFDNNTLSVNNIASFIATLLNTTEISHRTGTSSNYKSTKNALTEYIKTQPEDHTAIDVEFVRGFNAWLKNQNLTESTVSFYLRMLRAILNKAKERGLIAMSENWFAGLIISHFPEENDNRKTLTKDEINRIANVSLETGTLMDFSRDLFMFSFYCRGMERFDIFNLTKANIHGDIIIYNKRLTGKQQVVKIEPPTRQILDKYISDSDEYIFSAISKYTNCREYVNASRVTTVALTKLGEHLNLHIPLTFSVARNTWLEMTKDSNLTSMMLS